MSLKWDEVYSTTTNLSKVVQLENEEDYGIATLLPKKWNSVFPYETASKQDIWKNSKNIKVSSPRTTLAFDSTTEPSLVVGGGDKHTRFRTRVSCDVTSQSVFCNFVFVLENVLRAKMPQQYTNGRVFRSCLQRDTFSRHQNTSCMEDFFSKEAIGAITIDGAVDDKENYSSAVFQSRGENNEFKELEFYVTNNTRVRQADGTEQRVRSVSHLYEMCSNRQVQLCLVVRGWSLNRIFDELSMDVDCTEIKLFPDNCSIQRTKERFCSSETSLVDLRDKHLRYFARETLQSLTNTVYRVDGSERNDDSYYAEQLAQLFERSRCGDDIAHVAVLMLAEQQSFEEPLRESRQEKRERKKLQRRWCPALLEEDRQHSMMEDDTDDSVVFQDSVRCQTCLVRRANAAFVPCGHVYCCVFCVWKLEERRCPICRDEIATTLRLRFS